MGINVLLVSCFSWPSHHWRSVRLPHRPIPGPHMPSRKWPLLASEWLLCPLLSKSLCFYSYPPRCQDAKVLGSRWNTTRHSWAVTSRQHRHAIRPRSIRRSLFLLPFLTLLVVFGDWRPLGVILLMQNYSRLRIQGDANPGRPVCK